MTITITDNDLLPVEREASWPGGVDGGTIEVYRVGDWTFELPGDRNPSEAKTAMLAWASWYKFLIEQDSSYS